MKEIINLEDPAPLGKTAACGCAKENLLPLPHSGIAVWVICRSVRSGFVKDAPSLKTFKVRLDEALSNL